MAGDIDKGLYSAPQGIEGLADGMQEPDLEIEIEDPESVEITAGGMTIEIEPEPETADDFDANLADYMDDGELAQLSGD
jgi:hypothetical protein